MLHTSNDIRNPGLRTLPPGVERYFVNGGGLSLIEVLPEDKIEIINDEGRQICEIVVFNSKGKPDLSILNLKENSKASISSGREEIVDVVVAVASENHLRLSKSPSMLAKARQSQRALKK